MSQIDPRVKDVPAQEAERVRNIIAQMREQGKLGRQGESVEGELIVDTNAQEGLGQGLDPRFLDVTPDVLAAQGPANAWDGHTRMGGGRYGLVTNQPAITGATAPTPDMVAADRAEDPQTRRNRRNNRQILG